MACPQVDNGEEGLQIWTVAADVLNNQTRSQQGLALQADFVGH
jgi:hypothetical protein